MNLSKTQNSLRVRVYWGDILYDTALFEPHSKVTVGSRAGNRFLVDITRLFPTGSWDLARVEKSSARLNFSSKIRGFIRIDGKLVPLRSKEILDKSKSLSDDLWEFPLDAKHEANFSVGDVSFYLDWVSAKEKLRRSEKFFTLKNAFWSSLATLSVLTIVLLNGEFQPIPRDPLAVERVVTLLPRTEVTPPPPEVKPEPEPIKEAVPEAPVVEAKPVEAPPKPAPRPVKKAAREKKPATEVIQPVAPESAQSLEQDLGEALKNLTSLEAETVQPVRRRKGASAGAGAAVSSMTTGPKAVESVGLDEIKGQGDGELAQGGKLGLHAKSRPKISGGLSQAAIESIMKSREARIQSCYEKELQRRPGLRGMVQVRFVIGETGKVASTRVVRDTLSNAPVMKCILGELANLSFPEPQGGKVVTVEYPFHLAPRVSP